ncbi:MAG: hypothetical protein EOO90_07550 [Pedobacter sp.]|nr:MAG: hypothetical protein EOO90_07550 [Pedobacter sp.]
MVKRKKIISNLDTIDKIAKLQQKQIQNREQKPKINQSEATKKVGKDFGRCSGIASKILETFKPHFASHYDEKVSNRIRARIVKIFKTISPEFAGNKQLIQGNVKLLKGFRFNAAKAIDSLLLQLPEYTIQDANQIQIEFQPAGTDTMFKVVENATASIIRLSVYNMDLDDKHDEIVHANALSISLADTFAGAKLKVPLQLTGNRLVLVVMSLNYFKTDFESENKKHKAAEIVFANKFRNGLEIPFIEIPVQAPPVKNDPQGIDWELG